MSRNEKRKHERIQSLNLLNYTCLDSDGKAVRQGMGRTLNVSESGILLETYNPLESSNTISLTIALREDMVELSGRIIHFRNSESGNFEMGLEFFDVDGNGSRVLKEYIKEFKSQLPA